MYTVERPFIIFYLPRPEMEMFAVCVITFEPIKIYTQLEPQNDRLNLSFLKDENITSVSLKLLVNTVVGKKK